MKTAIIDADSIIHIVAPRYALPEITLLFIKELPEEEQEIATLEAYKAMDTKVVTDHIGQFINSILNATNATHYLGFLGDRNGSNTFRHKLAVTKPYKGQRKTSPPWIKYWKPIMVEYMTQEWKFIELSNIEADDACTICATHIPDCIICSPDKDLRQKSGEFYDYKKTIFETVSEVEANRRFYKQCIIGDVTDNICGVPKLGEKSKVIQDIENSVDQFEMDQMVYDAYVSKGAENIYEEQLALIYMLRDLTEEALVDLKEVPTPIERADFGIKSELPTQEDPQIQVPIFTFNQ